MPSQESSWSLCDVDQVFWRSWTRNGDAAHNQQIESITIETNGSNIGLPPSIMVSARGRDALLCWAYRHEALYTHRPFWRISLSLLYSSYSNCYFKGCPEIPKTARQFANCIIYFSHATKAYLLLCGEKRGRQASLLRIIMQEAYIPYSDCAISFYYELWRRENMYYLLHENQVIQGEEN